MFDLGGNEIGTVDRANYLTQRVFDAFGNATSTTEYATSGWSLDTNGLRGPTGSGTDRVTTDVYDRLNRKTSVTRNVDYSPSDNGAAPSSGLTTSWHYDAQDHVTWQQDAAGKVTYSMYDALGRLKATISPQRSALVDGASAIVAPVLEYVSKASRTLARGRYDARRHRCRSNPWRDSC